MKNITQKIILTFLSFWLLVISSMSYVVPSAHAQDTESTWYNQPFTEWYTKVYGEETPANEIFGERYTAAQVQWILWALISQPLNWLGKDNQQFIACTTKYIGNNTVDLTDCLTASVKILNRLREFASSFRVTAQKNDTPFLVHFVQNSVGIKYIHDKFANFNIVQPVIAQTGGFGYGHMGIMLPLWQVSRNLAYTFLVLFMVIFAFMIMFRVKISPQTVISIQSALPKIIIAAILATFSYAIAGLVIDLMYVVAGMLAGFLDPLPWGLGFRSIYNAITGSNGDLTLTSPLMILGTMFTYTILFFLLIVANFVAMFTGVFSLFSMLLSVIMLLLVIWLIILCVWYMIKIPWMLIKTLINIYLSVAVAPIQIVAGSIMPNIGFGAWFKNLIANVMVFPLVGLMFFLAFVFLGYSAVTIGETVIDRNIVIEILRFWGVNVDIGIGVFGASSLWSPPFLGSGAEITPLIFALMSFGIIIAIPKASDILKAIIMGAKFDYGTAIGEAAAPVSGLWGATGAPVMRSFGEAAGRARVKDIQRWVQSKTFKDSRIPKPIRNFIQSWVGNE